jgi:hypothetical protein
LTTNGSLSPESWRHLARPTEPDRAAASRSDSIEPPASVHVDALEAIDGTPILDLKIAIAAGTDA